MATPFQQLVDSLLGWFRVEQRDLPWRRSRDPYEVWVSEVMLQQTRVAAVLRKYEDFLARFADVRALARASDDELLTAWQGLGYYRRARNLREAARVVVAQHGGRVPTDPDVFGRLPGVGEYTRGAVLSIAHGMPLPAVDGNVQRVLSRLLTISGDMTKKPGATAVRRFVAELHARGNPGDVNQALMELGATVCTPKSPACGRCPWKPECRALATGRTGEFPESKRAQLFEDIETSVVLVERDGTVLARRVAAGEINEGQLCLPGLGVPKPRSHDLETELAERHRLAGRVGERLGTFRHSITRYRMRVAVHRFHASELPTGDLLFANPLDPRQPWSTIARKAFKFRS